MYIPTLHHHMCTIVDICMLSIANYVSLFLDTRHHYLQPPRAMIAIAPRVWKKTATISLSALTQGRCNVTTSNPSATYFDTVSEV